jgi:hypothetical protein
MPNDKYQHVRELYSECKSNANDDDVLHKTFDELLKFLVTNFESPNFEEHSSLVNEIFTKKNNISDDSAEKLPEAVFPIMVTRQALYYDRLPLNPSKLTNFKEWFNHSGEFIMKTLYPTI